jgi:hypothetical protein|uniref:Uncharacterized protein n=3 Tax=Oryza TaxID=4527 RepID=A0A0E0PQ31_ORYRU
MVQVGQSGRLISDDKALGRRRVIVDDDDDDVAAEVKESFFIYLDFSKTSLSMNLQQLRHSGQRSS